MNQSDSSFILHPSSFRESGRQESNLPRTAYQTVAAPLGFGPKKGARTEGVEPSAYGLEPHCSPRSTPL